jgi:hypothetical protein
MKGTTSRVFAKGYDCSEKALLFYYKSARLVGIYDTLIPVGCLLEHVSRCMGDPFFTEMQDRYFQPP